MTTEWHGRNFKLELVSVKVGEIFEKDVFCRCLVPSCFETVVNGRSSLFVDIFPFGYTTFSLNVV